MTTAELSIWIVKYEEYQTDPDWVGSHTDWDEILYEAVEMSENSLRIWEKQASFREELSEITNSYYKHLASFIYAADSEFIILAYVYSLAEDALEYKHNTPRYHAYLTHIKHVLGLFDPIELNLHD